MTTSKGTAMRYLIGVLAFLLPASAPLPSMAEPPPARVAFLDVDPPGAPMTEQTWQAFTEGLRALGWIEGRNITLMRHYSEGRDERAAALATELIDEKPDVIVAATYPNAKAVQLGTRTIPIVFINVPNPVGLGLVASLAHPGGNITGISNQTQDLVGKVMQLLSETRPGISRVAYLGFGEPPYWQDTVKLATAAAERLSLTLSMMPIKSPADFDPAFATIAQHLPDALVVSALPIFRQNVREIAAFAIEHRLPTASFRSPMAQDGLLFALGSDFVGAYRPAAPIVDKILKGAKPADIPVEQPTRFHLVVNLKTAHAIGLDLPPVLLAGADEVIE